MKRTPALQSTDLFPSQGLPLNIYVALGCTDPSWKHVNIFWKVLTCSRCNKLRARGPYLVHRHNFHGSQNCEKCFIHSVRRSLPSPVWHTLHSCMSLPSWEPFSFFKHLYWSIIALQWCVSFCFITKWISHTYTYVPTSPPSCVSPPPTLPIPLLQAVTKHRADLPVLISLCYAAASD